MRAKFEAGCSYKVWNKKGIGEKKKTSIKTNKVLQVGLKGGGREILLEGILTIQCFCNAGQHSLNINQN